MPPKKRGKRRSKKVSKKTKKTTHCVCSKDHHQMGGSMLSPAQMKMLQRPVRRFSTLPVNPNRMRQRGMGHCCSQCGGSFFGDLGSALTGAFHDPLRGVAAALTLGASEVIAAPADLLKRQTGVKASDVLTKGAPVIAAVGGPELVLGSKLTSKGLDMIGLGYQPMLR